MNKVHIMSENTMKYFRQHGFKNTRGKSPPPPSSLHFDACDHTCWHKVSLEWSLCCNFPDRVSELLLCVMCRNYVDDNDNSVDNSDEQHAGWASTHLQTRTRIHLEQLERRGCRGTSHGIALRQTTCITVLFDIHLRQNLNRCVH